MNAPHHTRYMSLALALAEQGRFSVSPNPMVGCVIVKNNHIVGEGYHRFAGGPHAEIYALQEAGEQAQGATAYVTLEPCCHQGKTPPCTLALISAGIKKIYVSCIDPNPLVACGGIEALRSSGVQVEVGLCAEEAKQLNEIFFYYIKHKRPFVIAKWAMTLNGKTQVHQHDDKQISCIESQYHTHQIRRQIDAILIGAHTACQDDPALTARLAAHGEKIGKQPIRILLSGRTKIPLHLKILSGQLPGKTIIVTTQAKDQNFFEPILSHNIELFVLPENKYGQVSLPILLDELGKKEITSLLVEGGMTVHESFFREHLVNKIHVYLSPVFIGALHQEPLNILNMLHQGQDIHFTAKLKDHAYV